MVDMHEKSAVCVIVCWLGRTLYRGDSVNVKKNHLILHVSP